MSNQIYIVPLKRKINLAKCVIQNFSASYKGAMIGSFWHHSLHSVVIRSYERSLRYHLLKLLLFLSIHSIVEN